VLLCSLGLSVAFSVSEGIDRHRGRRLLTLPAGAILSGLDGAVGLPAWKWLFLSKSLMCSDNFELMTKSRVS
jgi:hypothetical protein